LGDKIIYSIFDTAFGLCGIAGTRRGIIRLVLPGMAEDEIISAISSELGGQSSELLSDINRSLRDVEKSVKRYFNGERCDFVFPVDLSHCTEFQRKVYKVTRNIPYGEVKTYKWIAERLAISDAARAVGNALSKNPIPLIIPCHRVIKEDGKMGGFTAPGGIDLKVRMLKMEKGNYKNH
jgi:methylated-DNA-[protein]-cysteine S-methyltransferase